MNAARDEQPVLTSADVCCCAASPSAAPAEPPARNAEQHQRLAPQWGVDVVIAGFVRALGVEVCDSIIYQPVWGG